MSAYLKSILLSGFLVIGLLGIISCSKKEKQAAVPQQEPATQAVQQTPAAASRPAETPTDDGVLRSISVSDFVDNTEKYAGKTLELLLIVESSLHADNDPGSQSLKDLKGGVAEFDCAPRSTDVKCNIKINIPADLSAQRQPIWTK